MKAQIMLTTSTAAPSTVTTIASVKHHQNEGRYFEKQNIRQKFAMKGLPVVCD